MAKKKEIKKKSPITLSKEITCKCGKEWERKEVMEDITIHTMDSYGYKFLGKYTLNRAGYEILLKLNACPNCREEERIIG